MQQVTYEADHAVQFRQKNYSPLTVIMLSLAYTTWNCTKQNLKTGEEYNTNKKAQPSD